MLRIRPFALTAALFGSLTVLGQAAGSAEGPALSATLTVAPVLAAGRVPLRMSLRNHTAADLRLELRRAGQQSCATAPHVRVLRVGSREVVYPRGDEALAVLCSADPFTALLPSGGQLVFQRSVELPPGEYVIEAWLPGVAGHKPVALRYARIQVK